LEVSPPGLKRQKASSAGWLEERERKTTASAGIRQQLLHLYKFAISKAIFLYERTRVLSRKLKYKSPTAIYVYERWEQTEEKLTKTKKQQQKTKKETE